MRNLTFLSPSPDAVPVLYKPSGSEAGALILYEEENEKEEYRVKAK